MTNRKRSLRRKGKSRRASPLKATHRPSPKLAAVVGSSRPLSRASAVKAVWRYIKSRRLQHPSDGRRFRVDATLRGLFPGKKQANMFQVAKAVSRNLA